MHPIETTGKVTITLRGDVIERVVASVAVCQAKDGDLEVPPWLGLKNR